MVEKAQRKRDYNNNLIDLILERKNMDMAWEHVQAKKGGPGIDEVTLKRWGRNWEANIERLRAQVKTNTYRPNRPKRFTFARKGGGTRELSKLTVTDKVMQRAVLNVIEDQFDSRFLKCSHGYRPKRSVATAVQQVLSNRDKGLLCLVDADIEACFASLDHALLMKFVRRVIKDWFVLNLMTLWLKTGRRYRKQALGVPLGAVISPMWCNIYLHQFDARMTTRGWVMVRYADDFVRHEARYQHGTKKKYLPPVVGRQAYLPSLWAEQPTDEGSPGETTGSTGVVANP